MGKKKDRDIEKKYYVKETVARLRSLADYTTQKNIKAFDNICCKKP